MRSLSVLFFIVLPIFLLASCNSTDDSTVPTKSVTFSNPREVTISGYSGDAMEPFISSDGNTLFFNNLNSDMLPGGIENDTNLHYAVKTGDITFQYMGEVAGADTDDMTGKNELEAVASMDRNNQFYFVNTINYLDSAASGYLLSLYKANYQDGVLTGIESLPNLKTDRPFGQAPVIGELNFDIEIHYDGNYLYFVEGLFSGNPFPDSADIGVAEKVNGVFIASGRSSGKMAEINTEALEYAPSISTDRLELYFTRTIGADFGVYIATRSSVSGVWGNVNRIDAISGEFTEAPSISFDGKLLYYHQKISNQFRIHVVDRN
ncbi:MAG: PD40 domain-containing protein [Planctomycetes bacterium]|nr:PD40 domain-containing protein [Planctomycetota bacterium]